MGILPDASRSRPEVHNPSICLETVPVCSMVASKRFGQYLGPLCFALSKMCLSQSGQMSWARHFRKEEQRPRRIEVSFPMSPENQEQTPEV